MPDWSTLAALGAIVAAVVAIVAFLSRSTDRFEKTAGERMLSIREHNEYKDGTEKVLDTIQSGQKERLTIKVFDDWREQFRHDINRIEIVLRDMHHDLMQRVESREMVQTAQAKHDELQRSMSRLQSQLDTLQSRINNERI